MAKKYNLYDRIKDDNNKDIGIVVGFQLDTSDNEFAVVCLNAEYRLAPSPNDASVNNLIYIPSPTGDNDNRLTVPGLIIYSYTQTPGANEWLETKETATYGTQKTIDHVNNTSGITSPAATHARSKSFVIDGTTYYGQIPNAPEMVKMMFAMTKINIQDPSRTTHFDKLLDKSIYSFTQYAWGNEQAWDANCIGKTWGDVSHGHKNLFNNRLFAPVLELPNPEI